MVLLAAMSGCVTMDSGSGGGYGGGGGYMSHVWNPPGITGGPDGAHCGACLAGTGVPGVEGPWGQPVPMNRAYAAMRPSDAMAAQMMSTSVPYDVYQQTLAKNNQQGSGIVQAQAFGSPGMNPSFGPGSSMAIPSPTMPAIAPPGIMPIQAMMPPGMQGPGGYPPGAVAAVGPANRSGATAGVQRTEVRFVSPGGMKISWFAPTADGKAGFTTQYLEAPGRYNFMQAAIYRLKLSDIPNRPGVELYPTLEVVPTNNRTSTFLAHSAVPVSFTEADFQQVAAGNYVVKVIYLPNPEFQDLASTGPDELVSSPLEPGCDPIAEAHRRGSILLIVRLGNIDLEAPNTPSMDAPSQYAPRMPPGACPPGMIGAMPPSPVQMPPGQMPVGQMPGGPMLPGQMPGQMPGLPGSATSQPLPPVVPGSPVGKASTKSDIQQASYQQPAAPKSTSTTTSTSASTTSWWPFGGTK
jgi:hypothetical protein